MPQSSTSPAKKTIEKLFAVAFPSIIGWSFLTFVVAQRREIFSRLEYGLFDNNNWLPYAGGLIAIICLAFQLRGIGLRRRLALIPTATLVVTVLVLAALLVGKSSWARYRVYRAETLGSHWGVTAHEKEWTQEDVVGRISDPTLGPWFCDDKELLLDMVVYHATLFARQPREARIALASLARLGASIGDIASMGRGAEFLCYALAGETHQDPWYGLDWLQKPKLNPSPLEGFHAGCFGDASTTQLLQSHVAKLNSVSDQHLEALFYCSLVFPKRLANKDRQLIETQWSKRASKLGMLLDEGFRLREHISQSLSDSDVVRFHIETQEGDVTPTNASRSGITGSLANSTRALLLSTGKEIKFVGPSESEATIKLDVSGKKLYEYQQTLYETATRYERGRVDVFRGKLYSRPGREITKSVPVGSTKRNAYGAAVALKMHLPTGSVETDETLAYWADYRTKDGKRDAFAEISYESLAGRIWPFGIHESYYQRLSELEFRP